MIEKRPPRHHRGSRAAASDADSSLRTIFSNLMKRAHQTSGCDPSPNNKTVSGSRIYLSINVSVVTGYQNSGICGAQGGTVTKYSLLLLALVVSGCASVGNSAYTSSDRNQSISSDTNRSLSNARLLNCPAGSTASCDGYASRIRPRAENCICVEASPDF